MNKYLLLILSACVSIYTFDVAGTVVKDDINLRSGVTLKQQRQEGFKPRADIKAWSLKLPIDWGADPFKDRNWRYQLNAWRMTDPLLNEYFKTNDLSLVLEAFTFVEDWYNYHFIEKKSHLFSWYDMAAGIRAMRLAFFLDYSQRNVIKISNQSKEKLLSLVDIHIEKLKDEKFINTGNHGLLQIGGLNLLCKTAKTNPACIGIQDYIERKFTDIMSHQFTDEGIHTENSPSYHLFVLYDVLMKINALKGISNVEKIIKKAQKISPWLLFPNKMVARIGDSSGSQKNIPDLSTQDNEPTCLNKDRCFLVGDFTKSGYAIIRSAPISKNQSMLFVTGMAHNKAHKHSDELSFELYEFNRFIFIDSGKYGYQKDDMRKYFTSAKAHNTISLINTNIPINSIDFTGSLLKPIETTQDSFKITGSVNRNFLFNQNRTIFYNPGHHLRIEDFIKSEKEHTYVSSLHLAPDLNPEIFKQGFIVNFKEGSIKASVSDGCTVSKVKGQKEPILGWFSPSYLKTIPTIVIRATCPGSKRKIIWDIKFQKEKISVDQEQSISSNEINSAEISNKTLNFINKQSKKRVSLAVEEISGDSGGKLNF
ncbi:MAG: heparinase II/III-family protein [Legionellales bacterium]|nr:heparinase II/III-family protein [Legionellales bacterium]